MEGEKLFTQSKEIKKENPLLKGPDLIDPTIKREMKSMDFGFSSDNRRYLLQHTTEGARITVECYDSLPNELTQEEKGKFRKIRATREDVERDVFVLSSSENIEADNNPNAPKEYYIAEKRDFQANGFRNFLSNNDNRKILANIISVHTNLDTARAQEIADRIFDAEQSGSEELRNKNIGLLDRDSFEKMKIDVMANFEMPKPIETSLENLGEYIKGKRILFYTGAGISKDSGVHDMEELKAMLQIDQSQECDGFLKIAAGDPQKAAALWEQFTHVAHNNEPTPAHIAMTEIARQLQCKIFTENVDSLHEKTGIQALRPTGDWLRENIQAEWLKDIDIVITAGLSTDDRGFLAWYKENNPNGKILAINVEQPVYLGDDDLLLKGDVQEILPSLEKMLGKSEIMKLPEVEIKQEDGEILLSILLKGYKSSWGGYEHELNDEIAKYFDDNPLNSRVTDFFKNIKALEDGGIDEETLYETALTFNHPERIEQAKDFFIKYKSHIADIIDFEDLRNSLVSALESIGTLLPGNLKNKIHLATSEDIDSRIQNIERTKASIQGLIDFFRPSSETTRTRKITILPTDFLYYEQSGSAFDFSETMVLRSHIENPSNLEHEFLHGVVNPITEKLSEQLTDQQKQEIINLSSHRLKVEEKYGNYWESLLNEEMIRTYNEIIQQGREFLSFEKFNQIINGISDVEFQELMRNDEKLRERCNQLQISELEDLKQKSSQYYERFGESKLRGIIYNFYLRYMKEREVDEGLNFEQFVLREFKNVL